MFYTNVAYAIDKVGDYRCGTEITDLSSFINYFTCLMMNAIVPFLVALAVAAFVFGIIKYFLNPDNEEKRKEGKSYMFWGLVTLFVMVSIWALVGILSASFTPNQSTVMPSLPASQP